MKVIDSVVSDSLWPRTVTWAPLSWDSQAKIQVGCHLCLTLNSFNNSRNPQFLFLRVHFGSLWGGFFSYLIMSVDFSDLTEWLDSWLSPMTDWVRQLYIPSSDFTQRHTFFFFSSNMINVSFSSHKVQYHCLWQCGPCSPGLPEGFPRLRSLYNLKYFHYCTKVLFAFLLILSQRSIRRFPVVLWYVMVSSYS